MTLDIIKILKDVNFTEYEAKAYLALLEKSPLSGYAISLNSGVPRSKIYEVLGGLVDRGEVMVSHENPALYTPLPPNELINLKKRKAESSFEVAEEALENYSYVSLNRENIWNITGYEPILNRTKEAIKEATGRILLEIWAEDAQELKEELQAAAKRGVKILIVSYGDLVFDFAQIHQHDASEEITNEYGGRWIVLSADDREVVAGILSLGEDSRAAWTMHPGLVMPITEVIIHDLYIYEMMKKHRDILESSFGPNLTELRNRFKFGSSGYSVAAKLGLIK
ncbi:TrmB family transcriptional regulator [Priestia megaterium]|jgi:HTH-type transcriptional regulator, sugar sensing transcriptional regulator|uniref:TrmB family transcriptional regulator n=1 Tax=Priestia megaterium TaxID=1404 RepID=UPI0013F3F3F4|nr:TrmB family transcriptional regulator [Priestia megaterium]MDQ0808269.1 sugar-specific transcriptional regulator TrmB [Priestia megaterium]NGY81065.1 TrmB family transcriptional regulator [Priestia megaterium]